MNDKFLTTWAPLPFHASLWEHITPRVFQKKWPQTSLFIGPRHASARVLVDRLMAMMICEATPVPCGSCRNCSLVKQGIDPDIRHIHPETERGVIKIDQIRDLQQGIYQTPQRGSKSFIVIDPADKMNIAAANSLLKILEEPPSHVIFILIAEHLNSIPATILSRCQKFTVPSPEMISSSMDYLSLGQFYSENSTRAELFARHQVVLDDLSDLINEKKSPCTLAAQWSTFIFDDVIWLLYLLTAEAVRKKLLDVSELREPRLAFQQLAPTVLFDQLDKINAIIRKGNHNINVNQALVLEELLVGYINTH